MADSFIPDSFIPDAKPGDQRVPNWSGMAASHADTSLPKWMPMAAKVMGSIANPAFGVSDPTPVQAQHALGTGARALPMVAATVAGGLTGGNPYAVGFGAAAGTAMRDQSLTELGLTPQASPLRTGIDAGVSGLTFGLMQGASNAAAPLAKNMAARLWQGAVGNIPAAVLKRFPVPQEVLDAGISPKQYYAQMFAEQATPLGNPTRGAFRANVKNSAAQADALIQNAEGQIVPSTKMVQNTTMVPQTTSATRIPPPDPGDLAAQARTWMEANAAVQSAAKSHGMDPHELESLVLTDRPSIQDLAAAVQRHGFTPDELNQLREYAPTLRGADLPAATTTSQTSMVPKTTTTAKPVMIPKNNVTPAAVAGRAKGAGSLEDLKFGEDPARDIQQAHDVIDNWAAQQPERIPLPDIQRGKQQLSKRIQELYTTAATGGDNAVAAGPSRKAAIKALADAERSILEETVSGLQEANKRTQNAMAMRMIASKRADVTGPSPSFTSKNLIGPAGPLLWQGLESPAALSRYGIALGRPGVQQGLSMVPGALSGGGSLLTSPRNAVYPDSLSPTRGR